MVDKFIEDDDFENFDKIQKELDSKCICEYTEMIGYHCSKCGRDTRKN